ncbi:hypothetical protein ACIQPR_48705, partial [Streptomyces sp. NPDC091280]|uniref:hypothetical protein n=1 Tax=Streptomyces sp. NPDC091280 TaxID=3365984 RepID=UPI0038236D75
NEKMAGRIQGEGKDVNDIDLGAGLSVNDILKAHSEMTREEYAEFMKAEDERFMREEVKDEY